MSATEIAPTPRLDGPLTVYAEIFDANRHETAIARSPGWVKFTLDQSLLERLLQLRALQQREQDVSSVRLNRQPDKWFPIPAMQAPPRRIELQVDWHAFGFIAEYANDRRIETTDIYFTEVMELLQKAPGVGRERSIRFEDVLLFADAPDNTELAQTLVQSGERIPAGYLQGHR